MGGSANRTRHGSAYTLVMLEEGDRDTVVSTPSVGSSSDLPTNPPCPTFPSGRHRVRDGHFGPGTVWSRCPCGEGGLLRQPCRVAGRLVLPEASSCIARSSSARASGLNALPLKEYVIILLATVRRPAPDSRPPLRWSAMAV